MHAVLDGMQPIASQLNKTVSNTALSLTGLGFSEHEVKSARAAKITVETQPLRWLGGTPTAANGHLVTANGHDWILGRKLLKVLKFIRATGTDGVLTVTLYK